MIVLLDQIVVFITILGQKVAKNCRNVKNLLQSNKNPINYQFIAIILLG